MFNFVVNDTGTEIRGSNRSTRRRNVPVNEGRMGKVVGSKAEVQAVGKKETNDEGGVVKKGTRKRSKFYIVEEDKGGDGGMAKKEAGKRKVVLNKKEGKKGRVDQDKDDEGDAANEVGVTKRSRKSNGEKGVGCKETDVDRIHVRVSLWSLHRLIPNLSPKQRQDVRDMGFGTVLGFRLKDIPTRLSYWLLDNFNEDTCVLYVDGKGISITRETVRDVLGIPMGNVYVESRDEADFRHPLVVEWKQQFGKQTRYKHIPVEELIYTQTEGGWMFKLNFLVLYFTTIGEANRNATVNLRFLNCIQDENDIPGFDWCTYVLECLVRTKKNWVRNSHYCGPMIVLLVCYLI